MKNYLFFFRGGLDFSEAPAQQVQEVIGKWRTWVEELTQKGIYNGGERLTRGDAAVLKGSSKQIVAGAYSANGEQLGGYISIKADSLYEAIEVAKGCPIFEFKGNVEVREAVSA